MIIDWSNQENYLSNARDWMTYGAASSGGGSDVIHFITGTQGRSNRVVVFTGGTFLYRDNGINTESDQSTVLGDRFDDPQYYESGS